MVLSRIRCRKESLGNTFGSGEKFRSCLKFLTILKRLNFQGPVSGFCLPIGGYFGSGLSAAR